jgi:hypothetical protein
VGESCCADFVFNHVFQEALLLKVDRIDLARWMHLFVGGSLGKLLL